MNPTDLSALATRIESTPGVNEIPLAPSRPIKANPLSAAALRNPKIPRRFPASSSTTNDRARTVSNDALRNSGSAAPRPASIDKPSNAKDNRRFVRSSRSILFSKVDIAAASGGLQ